MESREDRIRAKAHALWEEAGRPEGRSDEHWMKAARLIDADQHKDKVKDNSDKRGPGIDIAPAAEGNSLGDIRPAGPAGRGPDMAARAAQRAETPEVGRPVQIWLIEPNAASDDPWWQGRQIWQLVVAAPSAAFARLEAERWALRQRRLALVGNESSSMNAGFLDEKLYRARPLPENVGPTRAEFDGANVLLLAGPLQSVARS